MDLWTALLDVLVLLLAAMALGMVCERLKQSAIIGYLLAGTLLGPNALNLMPNHEAVAAIAELGVALLLFTIGLEFSWRRLRTVGPIAIGGGTAQILVTGAMTAGICMSFGLDGRPALAVGALVALSSTACVLRMLVARAEIDAVHGRQALGILLLQDIAVVPLVLVVTALSSDNQASIGQIAWEMGRALGVALLLVVVLYVVLNHIVPLILDARLAARNRDLPILLAIVCAVGAAWASHTLHLSPALGAFMAGLLLAESPFATQIRADVSSLRTLFVTLFFSSIGMLANPAWVVNHWMLLLTVVASIVIGKTVITFGVVRFFRASPGHAVATSVCLAQVGEFSFVLAELARNGRLINEGLFHLIVAATVVTLFLTPYLVALAPVLAAAVGRNWIRGMIPAGAGDSQHEPSERAGHIVIIGFGPAGQRVATLLSEKTDLQLVVVELGAKTADIARAHGLPTHLGDATREQVLEHVRVPAAAAVVVTLPDPTAARQVILQSRALSPDTPVFARARYHVYRWELMIAGAETVIDEEEEVGHSIAKAVRRKLRPERTPPPSENGSLPR